MYKDDYFTGQPVFTQLLSFINKSDVYRIAKANKSDKYYKKFKTYEHLVTMLFAIFQKCTSLREVTTGMQASMHKLNHLGMEYCPRRSTLAEANVIELMKRLKQSICRCIKSMVKVYRTADQKNHG